MAPTTWRYSKARLVVKVDRYGISNTAETVAAQAWLVAIRQ